MSNRGRRPRFAGGSRATQPRAGARCRDGAGSAQATMLERLGQAVQRRQLRREAVCAEHPAGHGPRVVGKRTHATSPAPAGHAFGRGHPRHTRRGRGGAVALGDSGGRREARGAARRDGRRLATSIRIGIVESYEMLSEQARRVSPSSTRKPDTTSNVFPHAAMSTSRRRSASRNLRPFSWSTTAICRHPKQLPDQVLAK